jgi:chromosome segregation ATPase
MSWFKGPKKLAISARQPDPNPVIESRLQQLDELRHGVTVKRTQIADYMAEIKQLLAQARKFAHKAANGSCLSEDRYTAQIAPAEARAKWLQAEIRHLEAEIATCHDQIIAKEAELQEAMFDSIHNYGAKRA